jgi:monoamine oxidase
MLTAKEFESYKVIVESKETRETMAGMNPDDISRLGAEMSAYYARLSNELALVKDEIMTEFLRLVAEPDDGSKPMAAVRAEKMAEALSNSQRQVSRRQIEYLMDGIDKIAFACSARVRSFNKEGAY